MEQDERATHPPADDGPEGAPAHEREEGSAEDPSEHGGPRGNPAVDEEALRKKQEERDRPED